MTEHAFESKDLSLDDVQLAAAALGSMRELPLWRPRFGRTSGEPTGCDRAWIALLSTFTAH